MRSARFCPACGRELESRIIGGAERRVCGAPACGYVHWDNPVPVVAALVFYQGQVLLARNVKWPKGVYSLVTGFLERKETPASAVKREVKEELGLDGEVTGFIGHYPFAEMNQIILAYSVDATGELKLSEEIAETRRVPVEKLQTYDFGPLYITSSVVRDWFKTTSTVRKKSP